MSRPVRIPVTVKSREVRAEPVAHGPGESTVSDAEAAVTGMEEALGRETGQAWAAASRAAGEHSPGVAVAGDEPSPRPAVAGEPAGEGLRLSPYPRKADQARDAGEDWRDRALRLQAEMDNFRKRQQRLAQDQIQDERERLLRSFLSIVDDLERALAQAGRDGSGLREGVELTHRAALQLLQHEGVERIPDRGRPFDPTWHEAVATVDHRQAGVEPNLIVDVLAPGYRVGSAPGRLLRPARVVVTV